MCYIINTAKYIYNGGNDMKKIISLLLAVVMTVGLVGCGTPGSRVGYPDEDGYAEGNLNDTMHTYFFDYTIKSAYVCSEYEGYVPSEEGKELLVVEMTVKNTIKDSSIPMFDTDFQVQWNESADDAFDFPITFYLTSNTTVGENMFPAEYDLAIGEERTGIMVYEVPSGKNDFSISYQELFDDDSTGDTFFVYFTATRK